MWIFCRRAIGTLLVSVLLLGQVAKWFPPNLTQTGWWSIYNYPVVGRLVILVLLACVVVYMIRGSLASIRALVR